MSGESIVLSTAPGVIATAHASTSRTWNTDAPRETLDQRAMQERVMLHAMNQAIDNLEHATAADWDGEGADPVSGETISVARELARQMIGPATSIGEPPEIYPTPQGEIDFSWNIDGRMLIVGVCPPDGIIVYAGQWGEHESRGRGPLGTALHPKLRTCLELLVNPDA